MVFMSSARREGSCSSSWHRLWKRSRKSWRRARGSSTSSRAKRAGGGGKKRWFWGLLPPRPSLARRERGNEASKGLRMLFFKEKLRSFAGTRPGAWKHGNILVQTSKMSRKIKPTSLRASQITPKIKEEMKTEEIRATDARGKEKRDGKEIPEPCWALRDRPGQGLSGQKQNFSCAVLKDFFSSEQRSLSARQNPLLLLGEGEGKNQQRAGARGAAPEPAPSPGGGSSPRFYLDLGCCQTPAAGAESQPCLETKLPSP